jgi:hypothetical protein
MTMIELAYAASGYIAIAVSVVIIFGLSVTYILRDDN